MKAKVRDVKINVGASLINAHLEFKTVEGAEMNKEINYTHF